MWMSTSQAGEYAAWASKSALKLGALLAAQRHSLSEFRCPDVVVPCHRQEPPRPEVCTCAEGPETGYARAAVFAGGVLVGAGVGLGLALVWKVRHKKEKNGNTKRKAAIREKGQWSDTSSSSGGITDDETRAARARARALPQ